MRQTTRLDPDSPAETDRQRHVQEERIPEGGLSAVLARSMAEAERKVLVRAVSLSKSFMGTRALNDVSISLHSGEIFGLVGPNGAGKTTLLRILATLTQPDSGEAQICGYSLSQVRQIRARIGFMPDVLGVYDDMLVREYLEFFARASNIPDNLREYSIEETMKQVGVDTFADQPVDGLSRGMKQRLGLARAILHKPELLLLDEPASGLDPLARLELREILRRLQRQGATVLISSHVLEDLADMCDRIGVMDRGTLIRVAETQSLIQREGVRRMRLKAVARREELFEFLKAYPGVAGLRWDNESVVFRMEGSTDEELAKLLKDVVDQGIPLVSFNEEEPSLESAYLNVTRAGEGWEVAV
ncbi:MAG: ABC transporter ATP-binding protein [Armatimonadetes bacterium]|nr:ABC transporter ATP-binding protein [Armatimonadota bacterium]